MRHIILGTAGHVDHGKTALVKALTGVDTDRLQAEKDRGITIELGFALLALPSGRRLGLVDVPGHERFIRHMVAGATGIDLVLLVVAADEGVMPQTREHVDICRLLGVSRGLVAMTKADLVSPDELARRTQKVREYLAGTFLETAPIVPVSAVTGQGLGALTASLDVLTDTAIPERGDTFSRLPVDRVFTLRGFGTVVTGTLASGRIAVGDELSVMPSGRRVKVRGVHIHGTAVNAAEAGQRTALNLQGIDRAAIARGDVLATPGLLNPTTRLDVAVTLLAAAGKPLTNRMPVRFHAGTADIPARIVFPGPHALRPGRPGHAQILLERPAAVVAGERFILRRFSPAATIGGGGVLDPQAGKVKGRGWEAWAEEVGRLSGEAGEARLRTILARSGPEGIPEASLAVRTALARGQVRAGLERLAARGEACEIGSGETRWVAAVCMAAAQQQLLEHLAVYHARHPAREGKPKEELRGGLGLPPRLFARILQDLVEAGRVAVSGDIVRAPNHRARLDDRRAELREAVQGIFRAAALSPPSWKMVSARYPGEDLREIREDLLRDALLVRLGEDLYFDKAVLDDLRERYRVLLAREGRATPASFRSVANVSRKYLIPLMEYFDATRLTLRTGEVRILRPRLSGAG